MSEDDEGRCMAVMESDGCNLSSCKLRCFQFKRFESNNFVYHFVVGVNALDLGGPVSSKVQSLEEVDGHRWQLAPEPGMAKHEQPHENRYHLERSNVSQNALHPARHRPQPVIPHSHDLVRPAGRERVEFLVQFIGVDTIRQRKACVHGGWVPRPEAVVPHANHEQVEENRGEDQLRVANQDQEQHVHEDGRERVFPVADSIVPTVDSANPREKRQYAIEVRLASPKAKQMGARNASWEAMASHTVPPYSPKRCKLKITAEMRGLIKNMVTGIHTENDVNFARELHFLLLLVLVCYRRPEEIKPLRRGKLAGIPHPRWNLSYRNHHSPNHFILTRPNSINNIYNQIILERLRGDEYNLLVPHWINVPLSRPSSPGLMAKL
nr:FT-interacting protein 1-like protein [Ipomoea batatas]